MLRVRLFSLLVILLVACGSATTTSSTDSTIKPETGQPAFPRLGQYWVVDNGCHFDHSVVVIADSVFQSLKEDGIAEIAVICQTGIKNNGPLNDQKIWAMEWGRYIRLGNVKDQRAIVWLIRPDVAPADGRVTIEMSLHLPWYTAIDYGPGLDEAGNYANFNDFNGALKAITRHTNDDLRRLWQTHH